MPNFGCLNVHFIDSYVKSTTLISADVGDHPKVGSLFSSSSSAWDAANKTVWSYVLELWQSRCEQELSVVNNLLYLVTMCIFFSRSTATSAPLDLDPPSTSVLLLDFRVCYFFGICLDLEQILNIFLS